MEVLRDRREASRVAAILLLVGLVAATLSAFVVAGVLTTSASGVRNLPIALANLDRGTSYHRRQVNFGAQVVRSIR